MEVNNLLFICLFLLLPIIAKSQRGNTYKKNVENFNDKVGKVIIYNTVTEGNKDKILSINRYIDTTKPIIIKCGMIAQQPLSILRKGWRPVALENGSPPLTITFKNKRISISAKVFSSDQKAIAVIIDNKLVADKSFRENITEKSLEIFDDYDIPVLQIYFDKKENSIAMNGLFFYLDGAVIIYGGGQSMRNFSYGKPFSSLSDQEKGTFHSKIIEIARATLKELSLK